MSPVEHPIKWFAEPVQDEPEPNWLASWKWWLVLAMVAACWGLILSGVVWLT